MVERTATEQLIDQGRPSMIERSVITSPDCRRVAYVARAGKKRFAMVDWQEGKQYDRIVERSLVFSPDSQRWAYVARASKKRFVVVDGQGQKQHDRLEEGSVVFSPDSQRLAYVVQIENQDPDSNWQEGFVVVDGENGAQYNGGINERSLVFSPNRRRVAYVARKIIFSPVGHRWSIKNVVIVDGHEQWQYDWADDGIAGLVFSPDSQRVAYVAVVCKSHMVVIDRLEGSQYHDIVPPKEGGGVIFDSSNQLHYVARKGNAFYLVEERIT